MRVRARGNESQALTMSQSHRFRVTFSGSKETVGSDLDPRMQVRVGSQQSPRGVFGLFGQAPDGVERRDVGIRHRALERRRQHMTTGRTEVRRRRAGQQHAAPKTWPESGGPPTYNTVYSHLCCTNMSLSPLTGVITLLVRKTVGGPWLCGESNNLLLAGWGARHACSWPTLVCADVCLPRQRSLLCVPPTSDRPTPFAAWAFLGAVQYSCSLRRARAALHVIIHPVCGMRHLGKSQAPNRLDTGRYQ
jgi:hypothetical protein